MGTLVWQSVLFDGIQLYKEQFGSSYTYDDDGNVKSVTDLQGQTTTYEYTNNDLTKIIQNGKAKMTYTYDSWHNVKTAKTEEGLTYNFTYDTYGNNTAVSISGTGGTMTSTATYSSDGNRLVSTTDALGKVTTYGYNATTNVLEWVQYPEDTEDTRTEYTYDAMYRMASAACTTDTGLNLSASYTYSNDLLTAIQTPSTTYSFTLGDFDLRTSVKAGYNTLARYTYTDDQNRYLSALDYGNGDKVQYTYDDKGRLVTQTYEDGDNLYHKYDNSGNLASVWDSGTARTTYYYYDLTDRMMKYVEKGDDGYSHSVGYEYNKLNNLTQQVETINGVDHTTSYSYDKDNRVETVTTGGVTVTYTYDDLGRVSKQETKNGDALILTEEFTYTAPEDGKTSSQIATYYILSEGEYETYYLYTYDDNGNITKITERTGSGYSLETYYEYDSANQLIKERYPMAGYTYQWVYDDAGNILSRYEKGSAYGGFERTVNYVYDENRTGWGDLLTSYDGQYLENDRLGNIINDADWTYTWEHGRQLASMFDGTTTWSYTYNADGLRTKKTNGTTTYTYVYNGSQLTQMTKGTDTLYFTYDASGTPLTLIHNGTTYYYVTNIQGDVVGILNGSGESLVTYRYEASGKWLAQTGTEKDGLGALNPLRYRGYVYDVETGLYYLQSRYYNPELGRFICSDSLLDTRGATTLNMFAYCADNPVNNIDAGGNLFVPLVAVCLLVGVAGLVLGGCTTTVPAPTQPATNTPSSTPSTEPAKNTEPTEHVPTPEELMFAATVYAEAGGQNKRSKQAVAHVINNRVGTRSSWTTIESVISAKYQFDGYNSPMYQAAMNYYNNGICNNFIEQAAMDECLAVVIPIYSGAETDITGGALYFHSFANPSDWKYHYDYEQVYVPGTEKFWFYKP